MDEARSRLRIFLDRWVAERLGVPESEVTLDLLRQIPRPRDLRSMPSVLGPQEPSEAEKQKLLQDADWLLARFVEAS